MTTVVATTTLTAPFFYIDLAALFPGVFIVGDSTLGGPDVLGDASYVEIAAILAVNDIAMANSFIVGSSILGGPDVLGGGPLVSIAQNRACVISVGITRIPSTGPEMPQEDDFILGDSTLGGSDVLGGGGTTFPRAPRLRNRTERLQAISGQVFAVVPGSMAVFVILTTLGDILIVTAIWPGPLVGTLTFVGQRDAQLMPYVH